LNTDTLATLEYMSPETLNGSIYLKESDIYSFAVMAYELISERNFSNFTAFQHIDAITNKKYRPSLQDLNCSSDLKDLIEQAWHDNHKLRPSFQEICYRLFTLIIE